LSTSRSSVRRRALRIWWNGESIVYMCRPIISSRFRGSPPGGAPGGGRARKLVAKLEACSKAKRSSGIAVLHSGSLIAASCIPASTGTFGTCRNPGMGFLVIGPVGTSARRTEAKGDGAVAMLSDTKNVRLLSGHKETADAFPLSRSLSLTIPTGYPNSSLEGTREGHIVQQEREHGGWAIGRKRVWARKRMGRVHGHCGKRQ
jgi:hypothetical protein